MSVTLDKTVDFSHVMTFIKKQTATIEYQEKEMVRLRAATNAQDVIIQGLVKDMDILKAKSAVVDPSIEKREKILKDKIVELEARLKQNELDARDLRVISVFLGCVATGGLVYVAGPAVLALL